MQTTNTLPKLRGIRRIVFLGDSITWSGEYIAVMEAYLRHYQEKERTELLNLGLPSETVSGLTEPNHAGVAFPRPDVAERLDRVLAKTTPDMVVACYGMNCGIYSPFSEERFRHYQEGMIHLKERVRGVKARLWLMTPPPFDVVPIRATTLPDGSSTYPSGSPYVFYDRVLARYADWVKQWGKPDVTDIHTPLNRYLTDHRRQQADFTLAQDGVHLNETGHRLIARELLRSWGAPVSTLPGAESGLDDPLTALLPKIRERQMLFRDAYLTATGHKRPGLPKGVPLEELRNRE